MRAALVAVGVLLATGCTGDDEAEPQRAKIAVYNLTRGLDRAFVDAQGFPRPATERPRPRRGTTVIRCGPEQAYCPGTVEPKPSKTYYYVVRDQPVLTPDDFAPVGARQDFEPARGAPVVTIDLMASGKSRFKNATKGLTAEAQFAIVVDDTLWTAPVVDPREYPVGVETDVLQILMPSAAAARKLARELRA